MSHESYIRLIHIYSYMNESYMNESYMQDQKYIYAYVQYSEERWGAGVETQKNVRREIEGWGRVF